MTDYDATTALRRLAERQTEALWKLRAERDRLDCELEAAREENENLAHIIRQMEHTAMQRARSTYGDPEFDRED